MVSGISWHSTGQWCSVTNSETRGGGQARAIGENGANRPLMSFFHDSLHNKKKSLEASDQTGPEGAGRMSERG